MKFSNPYTNFLLYSLSILIDLRFYQIVKKCESLFAAWFTKDVLEAWNLDGNPSYWIHVSRESQLHHPLFFDRYKNFLAVSLYWHFVHSEKNQGQFHAEVVPFDGREEEGKRSSMWFRTNCLSNDKSWISRFHRWTKSKERTWILTWSILSMYDSTCALTGPVYELHILPEMKKRGL